MPDFLPTHLDAYVKASPGFVETLLQSRREELFTGLMRLHYPDGETFVFTLLDGAQQKLYHCLRTGTEIIPRQSWMNALDRPDASVFFMPMSVDALRLMQVACEAPISRVDEQILTLPQLIEQVKSWSQGTEPAVWQIRSEQQFDCLFLISGISNPVIEEISFVNGASSFSVNDSSFPTLFPSFDHFQITRYVSDLEHSAWQEHELRLAFNLVIRLLLNRFSELAGRMLTERLCERISVWLQDEGWNIKVTMNGLANHQLFETIESAVDVYVGIIRCFQDEASLAIGLPMAERLSRDILLKLDSYRRETLKRHIYNQNHLDTVTGKVWR